MLDKLNSYVEQGLLKRQVSPCQKLVLYDYTEKCQFDKLWDEVTLNHRGTVYELETGNIVARAFPKFFNFSEFGPTKQEAYAQSKNFSVYEKLDGSLGIVYYYDGKWRVNTRGSFTSDQAIKGLELLDPTYLNTNNTYLFEIIYPENRIVVDYAGVEKLVMLAVISTQSGVEYELTNSRYDSYQEAKRYDFDSISEVLAKLKTLPFNEEGYVVQFEDGSRAKFKGDEYVEMHRLISGLSPLTLWERMENGIVPAEFLATIPEEFRDRYEEIAEILTEEHSDLLFRIQYYCGIISNDLFGGRFEVTPENRKILGLSLAKDPIDLTPYVFPFMLDKQDQVHTMIKKAIRPTGNVL